MSDGGYIQRSKHQAGYFRLLQQQVFYSNKVITGASAPLIQSIMKTTISFISFMSASILAGIGCEDKNNLALIAGVVFLVLTIALVLSDAEETIK